MKSKLIRIYSYINSSNTTWILESLRKSVLNLLYKNYSRSISPINNIVILPQKICILYVCVILFFFEGCRQNKTIDPSSVFSNKVGNTYQYQVDDSILNKTYSVYISVIGKKTLENGSLSQIWIFKYPNFVDTNYVVSHLDSVIFYNKTGNYKNSIYIFPLYLNSEWTGSQAYDSTQVISKSSLQISAGNFSNLFIIKEKAIGNNYGLVRNIWFDQTVGIIYQKISSLNFGTRTKQNWTLINYSLNNH